MGKEWIPLACVCFVEPETSLDLSVTRWIQLK